MIAKTIRKPQPIGLVPLIRMFFLDVLGGLAQGAPVNQWHGTRELCNPDSMSGLNRTVALVGMMGAGKSSVGKRLALRLNLPFRDADNEIESAAGCTVSEIFQRYGEPAFRDGERRVISRLLTEPPHILATGGGAFIDAQTRAEIKKNAVSVWIRAPVDVLVERVSRRDTRPLLNGGNTREILERLYVERTPFYAEADIAVDSAEGPHAVAVERIVEALKELGYIA